MIDHMATSIAYDIGEVKCYAEGNRLKKDKNQIVQLWIVRESFLYQKYVSVQQIVALKSILNIW